MAEVEEIFTEDLGFKLSTSKNGIQLFSNPIDFESVNNDHLSLLSVGNKSGYFIASDSNTLIIDKLSKLNESDLSPSSFNSINDIGKISQIDFNADESKIHLLIDSKFHTISIDTFDKIDKNSINPNSLSQSFRSFKVSSTIPDAYSLLTHDDKLIIVNEDFIAPEIPNVTSFSYSLNGQEILYAKNGSNDLISVSSSNAESLFSIRTSTEDEGNIVSISHLSKDSFLVSVIDPEEESYQNYIITTKDGTAEVLSTFIADPLGTVPRSMTYYTQHLINWISSQTLTFVTSSLSTELNTVSIDNQTGEPSILMVDLDSNQPIFPIINEETGDDASPIGFALDLSNTSVSVDEPCIGVESAEGVLPKALILTHEGTLIGWWIFEASYLKKNELNLKDSTQYILVDSSSLKKNEKPSASKAKNEDNQVNSQSSTSNVEQSEKSNNSKPSKPQTSTESSNTALSDVSTSNELNPLASKSSQSNVNTGAFASTGFATAAKQNKDSPWGTSAFSSTPTTSTSGFGSSAFGSGNTSSGFRAGGFGQSGFALSSLNSKNNIFDSSKESSSASSAFGNLAEKSKPTSSPFAALNSSKSNASPFANLGSLTASTASPFSSLAETKPKSASPFDALSETKSKPASPFGALADSQPKTASPFGSLTDSKPKNTSPFGSLMDSNPRTSSPFNALADSKLKPASPFGSLSNSNEKESPSFSDFNDSQTNEQKESSPFAEISSGKESLTSSFSDLGKEDLGPTADDQLEKVSGNSLDNYTSDESTPAFGSSFGSSKSPSSVNLHGQSSTTKASQQKPSLDNFALGDLNESLEEALDERPQNQKESHNENTSFPTSNLPSEATILQEAQHKYSNFDEPANIEKDEDNFDQDYHDATSVLSNSDSDEFNDYDYKAIRDRTPQIRTAQELHPNDSKLLQNQEALVKSNTSFNESKASFKGDKTLPEENDSTSSSFDNSSEDDYVDPIDLLLKNTPPMPPQYLIYDGILDDKLTSPKTSTEMIERIYQETTGQFTILKRNFKKLREFIEQHDSSIDCYTRDALQYPTCWKLSSSCLLHEFVDELSFELQETKSIKKEQNEMLAKLSDDLDLSADSKIVIGKLLSQLQVYLDSSSVSNYRKYPLDAQQESLQRNLRRKCFKVEEQVQLIYRELLPLKAKNNSNDDTAVAANLSQVIYEVNKKALQAFERVSDLEDQVSKLNINDSTKRIDNGVENAQDLFRLLAISENGRAPQIGKNIQIGEVKVREINFST